MFLKLFKYDLAALFKRMLFMYALVLITFAMTYIADLFQGADSSALQLVFFLLYAIFYIIIGVTSFFSFIIGINYFYQSTFQDQGYLTNTLPVSKMKIVASKMFANLAVYIFTILFIIIVILIKQSALLDAFQVIMYVPAGESIALVTLAKLLVVQVLLSISCIYLSLVYLGISLGSSHSTRKVFYAILYSIGLCLGFTFLSMAVLAGVANPIADFLIGLNIDLNLWQAALLIFVIIGIITTLIIGIVWNSTALNMKKRLNLE